MPKFPVPFKLIDKPHLENDWSHILWVRKSRKNIHSSQLCRCSWLTWPYNFEFIEGLPIPLATLRDMRYINEEHSVLQNMISFSDCSFSKQFWLDGKIFNYPKPMQRLGTLILTTLRIWIIEYLQEGSQALLPGYKKQITTDCSFKWSLESSFGGISVFFVYVCLNLFPPLSSLYLMTVWQEERGPHERRP